MAYSIIGRKQIVTIVILLVWLAAISFVIFKCLSDTFVSANERKIPIYSVETDEKQVALTFNCAWGDETTDAILDILKENNIKCTFFIVGEFAEKYPESVRKIYNAGHEIANHSMHHTDPVTQQFFEITADIDECNALLKSITGVSEIKLYRAPSGSYDNKTIEAAESLGMKTIQWDVDSIDWKNPSPDTIVTRVCNKAKNGSVVLFHLGKENTLEALSDTIDRLFGENYSFVKVSDLLIAENYYIDNNGRQCKVFSEQ